MLTAHRRLVRVSHAIRSSARFTRSEFWNACWGSKLNRAPGISVALTTPREARIPKRPAVSGDEASTIESLGVVVVRTCWRFRQRNVGGRTAVRAHGSLAQGGDAGHRGHGGRSWPNPSECFPRPDDTAVAAGKNDLHRRSRHRRHPGAVQRRRLCLRQESRSNELLRARRQSRGDRRIRSHCHSADQRLARNAPKRGRRLCDSGILHAEWRCIERHRTQCRSGGKCQIHHGAVRGAGRHHHQQAARCRRIAGESSRSGSRKLPEMSPRSSASISMRPPRREASVLVL